MNAYLLKKICYTYTSYRNHIKDISSYWQINHLGKHEIKHITVLYPY